MPDQPGFNPQDPGNELNKPHWEPPWQSWKRYVRSRISRLRKACRLPYSILWSDIWTTLLAVPVIRSGVRACPTSR